MSLLTINQDCANAFERLQKLDLTEKQNREIIKVIVQCCIQEASFNPYYPLVASRFCKLAYSFRITFQFTLWDSLKLLEESDAEEDGIRKISNLAKMTSFMICNDSIPFNVIRVFILRAFLTSDPDSKFHRLAAPSLGVLPCIVDIDSPEKDQE